MVFVYSHGRMLDLPFRKHLEWLCLENMDDESIHDFYDNVQLPIPTEKDIEASKEKVSRLMIPPGQRRRVEKGVYKIEDAPIWDKLGYGELFRWRCGKPTTNWKTVGKILNHPLLRTSLDVCLITHFDMDKVTTLLPQVYSVELNASAVELYQKYFADFADFERKQWMGYLERLREDNYVFTRIFTAITKSREEALFLCGLPSEKQFSDFLKNVLATANYKFNYYSKHGNSESDLKAMDWAKIGIVAGEKFEKFGAGDVSDFAKLVQTEFEYVDNKINVINPDIAASLLPAPLEDKNQPK